MKELSFPTRQTKLEILSLFLKVGIYRCCWYLRPRRPCAFKGFCSALPFHRWNQLRGTKNWNDCPCDIQVGLITINTKVNIVLLESCLGRDPIAPATTPCPSLFLLNSRYYLKDGLKLISFKCFDLRFVYLHFICQITSNVLRFVKLDVNDTRSLSI